LDRIGRRPRAAIGTSTAARLPSVGTWRAYPGCAFRRKVRAAGFGLVAGELRYLPLEGRDLPRLTAVLRPEPVDDPCARGLGCRRRPELPLGVDDDRRSGPVDRPAADPGDPGAGLVPRRPDPDHLRLPGLAVVGDVDVVVACCEIDACVRAEG